MEEKQEGITVCVTGASGFIGSCLVMKLLERGYYVKATVRDPENIKKVKFLLNLPNAGTHLSLWKADLSEEGSFDDAIQGCSGVFHVATPMEIFSTKDPENEVIIPTWTGVLNVMRSCTKAKTVKRVIFTSSIATIHKPRQEPVDHYDESMWTDIDLCRDQKCLGWCYYVAKTMAEKAAWKYAEENNIDLVTIQPPFVVGPFLTPTIPVSVGLFLSLITKNEPLYQAITGGSAVHIDDLCNAHIYLLDDKQAKGRYICSSHSFTIFDVAKSLKSKYPEYNIPTEFEDLDESSIKVIPCSSKKLLDLGFKFKYNAEEHDMGDLCAAAIESCKVKGLLDLADKEI